MKLTILRKCILASLLLANYCGFSQIEGASNGTTATDSASVSAPNQPIVVEQTWLIDPKLVQPRLQALQKEIPLTYNNFTHQFVEYFAYRKPSFTKTMLEKKDMFFPLYEKYLKKYGLPDELKYLSLIESGLNPRVISRAGAGGLWQFMPKTARIDFGLRIDEYVDERFDPERATEAACRYMRQLYNIFGDWHLVLAAYNTGPGNVRRAIRKCNGGQTFWDIYNCLPKETRSYVPQYIGMLYMINHAESHDIFAENIEQAIPHDTIHVNSFLDLDKFASLSNISLEDIQRLNPHILTHILPGHTRNFSLKLPRTDMAFFKANRGSIMDSATKIPSTLIGSQVTETLVASTPSTSTPEDTNKEIVVTNAVMTTKPNPEDEQLDDDMEDVVIRKKPKKKYYIVRRSDNLSDIADKFNVDVFDIKVWNHLRKSTIVPGQKLLILKESAVSSTVKYADARRKDKEAVRKGKIRFHRVESGDTLWNISQRYGGLSVDKLKKLNGIRGNVVRPGTKLRVS